jgi:collagen type III alpha
MRIRPCTALSPIAALAFAFCLQISGARAQSMEWTVIESTGSVLVVQPLVAARPVSLQDVMAPGSIVTTGGDGHAELRRGGQSIAIGPNSRIALPAAETGGMTKIIQDFGAALFKVDKQQNPHFEVDTPMIAAVVKGTTFTVSAGSADDSVHVVEGLVQVAPRSGGARVRVRGGVTGVILQKNPGTI